MRTAEVLGLQNIAVTNCAFPLEKASFLEQERVPYISVQSQFFAEIIKHLYGFGEYLKGDRKF